MSTIETIAKRFISYRELGEKAINQLDDKQIHWKHNENDNTIYIIVKHLHGNMLSRFTDFLVSDGEKPWRKRDDEFEDDQADKNRLFTLWNDGWNCLIHTLDTLTDQDLQKIIVIRGEKLTVMDALIRQVAHYASHVGQIVYIAKTIKGSDWQNLSVPRGGSGKYTKEMQAQHRR